MSGVPTSLDASGGAQRSSDGQDLLAELVRDGDGDATRATEATVATFLAAMVSRQQTLDAVAADLRAKREQARIAHDRRLSAIRQQRTERLGATHAQKEQAIADATAALRHALRSAAI
jgi:hypothetical protein